MSALAKASLYFTEGGSDKEYHAEIVAVEGGNLVNFRYGRRGGAMASGTKTSAPVDFAKAKQIFDKLVKEKTSKGYTPEESGSAYQGTENAGLKTDFVPQLLNPIAEEEAMRLIKDDDWVAQEKMDGERRAAHANNEGEVIGMNRRGLAVPLPQAIADQLRSRAAAVGTFRFDGEIIGDVLYIFDLLIDRNESCKAIGLGWLERMTLARQAVAKCENVRAVPVAVTTEEKRALWEKVKAAKGEGVVFKRRNAVVKEGRPNSGGDMLKYKFTESASCFVMEVNSGKRSVKIGLLDNINYKDVDDWKEVCVGNVTIPANYNIPAAGDIVEVLYLYAYKGGSLFQPVYRGKRTDLDDGACVTGQLKYKPEAREDDDA